jgi:hypothetical protein
MAAPAARTVQTLSAFLAVAKKYELDPLVGELYLIETEHGPKVCTGRETFVRIASRQPGYLGIVSGVVREGDTFQVNREGSGLEATDVSVQHGMGLVRGELVAAYCVAYCQGRAPIVIVRRAEDYAHLRGKLNWRLYGDDMLETRCIVAALRRQFPLAGLYVETEFADDEAAAVAAADQKQVAKATAERTAELRGRIAAAAVKREEPPPPAAVEPTPPPALELVDDAAEIADARQQDREVAEREQLT